MGGRVAEELTQDDITTGAGNDIERATELARRMVCEWGMSELGPLSFGANEEPVFLGRDFAQRADYSEDTAHPDRPRGAAHRRRRRTSAPARSLTRTAPSSTASPSELLEHESLDGDAVYQLIEEVTGRDLRPYRRAGAAPRAGAAVCRGWSRPGQEVPAALADPNPSANPA